MSQEYQVRNGLKFKSTLSESFPKLPEDGSISKYSYTYPHLHLQTFETFPQIITLFEGRC